MRLAAASVLKEGGATVDKNVAADFFRKSAADTDPVRVRGSRPAAALPCAGAALRIPPVQPCKRLAAVPGC